LLSELSEKRVCRKKFDDQFLAKTDKYLHNFYIINYLGPSSHVWSCIPTRQGFHLGLWPNQNPLLILSEVDIVLSGREHSNLPPTVCIIVYSVVCQVAALPFSNSLSIVYSVLYSLPPIYSCLQCAQS